MSNLLRLIAFFATPHQGSQLADWGTLIANIVSVFRSTSTANLEILQRQSDELLDLAQHFSPLIQDPKLRIATFFETQKTKIKWKFGLSKGVLVSHAGLLS